MASAPRRFLTILVLLAGPGQATAYQTGLIVRGGPLYAVHSDLLVAPFRQYGTGYALGFEFDRNGLSLSAGGAFAASSPSETLPRDGGHEQTWFGVLASRVLWDVASTGRIRFRAGPSLSATAYGRQHHYETSLGRRSELFADLFVPLSGAVSASIGSTGSTRLEEILEVGLIVAEWRSPFSGAKFFPSGRLTALWGTRLVTHRLALTQPASRRLLVRLEHRTRYVASDRHRTLRILQQELTVGIILHLGGGSR